MNSSALPLALFLVVAVAGLSVAARRLRMPTPMLMLGAGILASFVPGLPRFALDPRLIFLVLLPPLLYASGVGMSWRGFRSNLRPILLLAIGCVVFTAVAVAALVHYAFQVPWAVALVLGAIVAPPDSVAPMAIARRLGLPRRLITVLEGESLVNDASALVLFSFALAAVESGHFSAGEALGRFLAIVAGELGWGLGLGALILRLRHLANDARAEVLLALATPYAAFWVPHAAGGSGVIACVAAGLFVSWNGRNLIRPATRLQGYFIWDLVTWTIEALLFLLTGLQAHIVFGTLAADGLARALVASLVVSVAVVVVRFVWVFPATYLPRLIPALRRNDPSPNWRVPFLVAFTGLRGAVSIAAALSIPVSTETGPFPDRDLVLTVTFVVIAFSLLGPGAMLPWVIRRLGLARSGREEAARNRSDERRVRLEGIDAVLAELDRAARAGAPPALVDSLRRHHTDRRERAAAAAGGPDEPDGLAAAHLQLQLIRTEHEAIARAYTENRITDEARRRIERELDLEEARLRHAKVCAEAEGGDPAGAA